MQSFLLNRIKNLNNQKMKLIKLFITILFFIICLTSLVNAQSGVVSSGGRVSGSGGSVSYSIGQTNDISIKNNVRTVTQGLQQPFEIFVIEEDSIIRNDFQISATAYPNPASAYLRLRIDEGKIEDLFYKIFDEQGRLISQQKIVDKLTTISLNELGNSLYFVKVYKSIFLMKSFKIIKNN